MLRYQLQSMGVKVTKTSPIFVEDISEVLNVKTPGRSLN